MKNINLLFSKNDLLYNKKTIKVSAKKTFDCIISDEYFTGATVNKIIRYVNSILKYYSKIRFPIRFIFDDIKIADKLTYEIFECICYYLIEYRKVLIQIYWNPITNITTRGINSSVLKLLNSEDKTNLNRYSEKFRFEIYQQHFRKIIQHENADDRTLGSLSTDIDSFLKYFNVEKECRDIISDVIGELVGNALEHAKTDCLIDIDVTEGYKKRGDEEGNSYYGVNIVVLNFSNLLVGDSLQTKFKELCKMSERYKTAKKAYENHSLLFSENYTEGDFFNILAFQHKISGRDNNVLTGGTGLTKLINSLQSKSEEDSCYLITGKRCLIFEKEYLNYDDGNWIGFNKENNFIEFSPSEKAIDHCKVFFPGTAYNLNFALKRES